MLGVATMIVVNAVMFGFTNEMKDRIQGILADVIFQSRDMGFPHYDWHRQKILNAAGDLIEELTPAVVAPGMLTYRIGGTGAQITFQVDVVGIDVLTQAKVSKIASYLQHPENRKNLSFDLREDGYDVRGDGGQGAQREALRYAGWAHRRFWANQLKFQKRHEVPQHLPTHSDEASDETEAHPNDPFITLQREATVFDPALEQQTGVIVGIGTSLMYRESVIDPDTGKKVVVDELMLLPGDDVRLAFTKADLSLQLQSDSFTVVDLYESKMAEYDRKLVFVPIEKLQQLRGMIDPESGTYTTTQILIKAKPGVNIDVLRDRLRATFPPQIYDIKTWKDDQSALLSALGTELAMLNVLLFLIFAVAGFGILAIFYMIVVEKQKDIGILKALGASNGGIMQIFLYYSLLLGIVGSALGLGLGLLMVEYIKEIATVLSYILQRDVFSPEVYSFYEIPTIVDVPTVMGIIAGAMLIAAAAGVLPAIRAARVHPVETIRG